ncbi:11829_t:CDS:2 [Diversispora eburnea]|uniref:11829_t:CDS:1 n=1 Tax=Diversispora eburnea TaxID=1213867 RepID=A0A9N8W041_9GLOM|nr:11829_t:CDS:2 [Diversispora eburnea]
MKKEVEILGWIASYQKQRIHPKRIKAIKEWEWPNNLHGFIGVINFLHEYIPNAAKCIQDINKVVTKKTKTGKIMKKAERTTEDKEAKEAFERLKEIITEEPFLKNLEWEKPVEIYTDASETTVGGVIIQEGRVVCYHSKSLGETEQRRDIITKEAMAINEMIKEKYQYLNFNKGYITLYYDNRPLVDMIKSDQINKKEVHGKVT